MRLSGARVELEVDAPPKAVMDVLADGWLFGLWVVGAAHIRGVDPDWPSPGSRIDHSLGLWPLLLQDHTQAVQFDPDGLLVLHAHIHVLGQMQIRLEVNPAPEGCRVRFYERSMHGPVCALRPLEPVLLAARNRESLLRLSAIARGRTS